MIGKLRSIGAMALAALTIEELGRAKMNSIPARSSGSGSNKLNPKRRAAKKQERKSRKTNRRK